MRTIIVKVWIDNEAVYTQTNKGEVFSNLLAIFTCVTLYLLNMLILNTIISAFVGKN